jgi:hypothetical protein
LRKRFSSKLPFALAHDEWDSTNRQRMINTASKSRDIRLDTLRGLLLIIMAAVHVPTPLSRALQEPFGFTSAAEGFVFLGASLAGFVYGKTYWQTGWGTMSRRVWNRSKQIYFIHVGLVVPAALFAWALGARLTPLADHFHDFLMHPWGSLALLPLLLHQPPLFDILPLYVVLLGATPFVLTAARRYRWKMVLFVSAFIWLVAQFKWEAGVIGDPSRLLPLRWGSFNLLAWQFLWVSGLALGETAIRRKLIRSEHRVPFAVLGGAIVLVGVVCRHGCWPQAWFPPDLYLWMDKWTLGPLRLLNFGAWVVLLLALNPSIPSAPLSPLALLGRHSLAVFSIHVPLAIVATTTIEMLSPSKGTQVVLGLLVIAMLFAWAALQESRGHQRKEPVARAAAIPATVELPDQIARRQTPAGDWTALIVTN